MNLIELKERQDLSYIKELNRVYTQFGKLLKELNKRQLSNTISEQINQEIEEVNSTNHTGNKLLKLVRQKQTKVVALVEKQLKVIPQKYYTKLWLAAGMGAFGLPLGVAFGLSLGNMAFLSIGLPIGMAIGVAVGTYMDKKASDEGRQLDIEIK